MKTRIDSEISAKKKKKRKKKKEITLFLCEEFLRDHPYECYQEKTKKKQILQLSRITYCILYNPYDYLNTVDFVSIRYPLFFQVNCVLLFTPFISFTYLHSVT